MLNCKCVNSEKRTKYLATVVFEWCRSCYEFDVKYVSGQCCFNPDTVIARKIREDGKYNLRKYCMNCQKFQGPVISSKNKDVSIYPIEEESREDNSEYSSLFQRLTEAKRRASSKNWHERYEQYLKSSDWKELRAKVLERDNMQCKSCGCSEATEVHHLTYDGYNAGFTPLWQLESVCRPCHESIHGRS